MIALVVLDEWIGASFYFSIVSDGNALCADSI